MTSCATQSRTPLGVTEDVDLATKNLNKTNRWERNQNISSGLRAACPKASIPVNGKMVKAADGAKLFDDASEAEQKVIRARAQYLAAVEEARAAE